MIVVDRVEGKRAVLEVDGEIVEVSASVLPPGAGEGSVLTLVLADAPETTAEAEARLARLRAAGPKGDDIDLTGES